MEIGKTNCITTIITVIEEPASCGPAMSGAIACRVGTSTMIAPPPMNVSTKTSARPAALSVGSTASISNPTPRLISSAAACTAISNRRRS